MSAESDDADARERYYLVTPSATAKKRHRPDDTGDEPTCRAFLSREDASWRKLSARQTVFYGDCKQCFPGGGDETEG